MTPAEKYFAFLDRVSPMNLFLVADLDRALDIDQVAECWPQFVRQRALPRVQVRSDLTVGDGGTVGEFTGRELPSTEWDDQLSREAREPFGTERPMRCCYFVSPDEGRARLVFVVHHAVVDGRVGVTELQAFIRAMDGQSVPSQPRVPTVFPATTKFPWQQDHAALRALLADIRSRTQQDDVPEPRDWPHPSGPRSPRFFSLTLDGPPVAGFLAAARAHRTKAYPAMAAAWLRVAAGRLTDRHPATWQLATPVDITGANPDPAVPAAPVISVVANRFRVAPEATWELAAEIGAALDASMERGEAELFFHLTRAERVNDLDTGARVVARAIAAAPPAISVTNLGVIDPGSDPPWLRTMCGYLAPTPNQVIFVSGLGYRGRLVHSISTDDTQLDPGVAAALVTGYAEKIRTIGEASHLGPGNGSLG
jgi:hypothetical protein